MNIYLYHLTQDGVIRYVGITTNPSNRKKQHKKNKPSHTFEIIDTFTNKEEAAIAEQYHIAGHNTFLDGWNRSIGGESILTGENHPRYTGFDKQKWSKEYNKRAEVITRTKERRNTPEYKAKMKDKWKEYSKEYEQTSQRKAYRKAYYLRKKAEKLTISSTCL